MSEPGDEPESRDSETTGALAADALGSDPALAKLVSRHGPLELEPAADPFERLVVSLVRQQISVEAAAAIRERLFDAVEITPEGVLAADSETLRTAGLSASKATYVRNVATAFLETDYDRETFAEMSDEAVSSELTAIRGVGPWTAKMFLLFALGRPDIFPVEDLGVRRGMELVCQSEMTRAEMSERAEAWRPYRSYASLYLWRAYEG